MYKALIKRFFDIVMSILAIVLLSWLLLIISLAIMIDDPGSILFMQKRVGKNKKLFMICKFRSMKKKTTPHDIPTHMLKNPEQYITRVGKILRKTSLDELPQIFNILIGQMSIIGPRPALWNQYDLIAERDKYIDSKGNTVNNLRPGLTGWAQINGRDELPIETKAKLDGQYAQKLSFAMDWNCFWGTVLSVVKREGIVEGGTGVKEPEPEKEVFIK